MMVKYLFHDNRCSWLAPKYGHVNMIIWDNGKWMFTFFDGFSLNHRMINRVVKWSDWYRNFHTIASTLEISIEQPVKCSQWLIVPTCNEIIRLATGVDVGRTINPVHLYYKLLKYNDLRNYSITDKWERYAVSGKPSE